VGELLAAAADVTVFEIAEMAGEAVQGGQGVQIRTPRLCRG